MITPTSVYARPTRFYEPETHIGSWMAYAQGKGHNFVSIGLIRTCTRCGLDSRSTMADEGREPTDCTGVSTACLEQCAYEGICGLGICQRRRDESVHPEWFSQ